MITYIRNNIKGYYIEVPEEIDSEYWAGKIGTTYNDFLDGKWVLLSAEQVTFHELNPLASIREVLNMELSQQPERTLEQAKNEKIQQIETYNNSDAVNQFNVVKDETTVTDWLTPDLRSNYRNSIDAAKLVGLNTLSLYVGGIPITLPTQTAELILAQILLYADQCFIVTKQHEAYVNSLETIADIDAYNITLGYPEKLTFNLDSQQEEPEEEEVV